MDSRQSAHQEIIGKGVIAAVFGFIFSVLVATPLFSGGLSVGDAIFYSDRSIFDVDHGSERFVAWVVRSTPGGQNIELRSSSVPEGKGFLPIAVYGDGWEFPLPSGNPTNQMEMNDTLVGSVVVPAHGTSIVFGTIRSNAKTMDKHEESLYSLVKSRGERMDRLNLLTTLDLWIGFLISCTFGIFVYWAISVSGK